MRNSILLFLLTILVGCGTSKQELIEVNPEFQQYISAYSSGMQFRDAPIKVVLTESQPDLLNLKEKELNELFEIYPEVEGKVILVSERRLEFVPKNPLPMNQLYTVSLKLEDFMEIKDGFETFTFQFSTYSQQITVRNYGLRFYNSYSNDYQYLEGRIQLTDKEDKANIEKILSAKIGDESLNITFKGDDYTNEIRFKVDSILRKKESQILRLFWSGVSVNSISSGTKGITVSGKEAFSVSNIQLNDDGEQSIRIDFSENLNTQQNLKGLIKIDGIPNFSTKIEGSQINVLFDKRFEGNHTIHVFEGVENVHGDKMGAEKSQLLSFDKPKPLLRLSGGGSILPNSQGLIFPFEAIALKSVDVRIIRIFEKNVHHFLQVNELNGSDELTRFGKIIAETKIRLDKDESKNLNQWNTHVIDLSKFIKTEPGSIYQVALKFNQNDAICDCEKKIETENEADEWNERNWHKYGFNGYSSWSYSRNTSVCSDSYYYGKAIKKNILGSDIGMIYKLDKDKKAHIFVTNLISSAPMDGTKVFLYDYTSKLIAQGTTNAQGMMEVKLKEKPFLLVCKKGEQRGYLKLRDGNSNSLSKFDVSGTYSSKDVKGYIYAERGVWRPGDSIFTQFILEDGTKSLPSNHPVKFQLKDPAGNIVYTSAKRSSVNGVYDFRTATTMSSKTGNYSAVVKIGDMFFTKRIAVETIKPNRLKIAIDVQEENHQHTGVIESKWLHGAPGKGLKAEVSASISPMNTTFKGYKNYAFDSPIRKVNKNKKIVLKKELDKDGKAEFNYQLNAKDKMPGKVKVTYSSKVFEKSGNYSTDYSSKEFSPFERYVGIATPNGSKYDGSLEAGQTHTFEMVVLNKLGKTINNVNLEVKIYKLDWNWWYHGSSEDVARFNARKSTIEVLSKTVKTKNGTAHIEFKRAYNEYGKYMVIVTDKNGGHQTGKLIRIDWPYWERSSRSDNEFAKMLTLSTNKTSYKTGEEVHINFPSSENGRALISVESSKGVLKKFWVKTQNGETNCSFISTEKMTPNVYVHVTLIQPHLATKNDMPIRMYGIQPIQVEEPATHLYPKISMKDEIRPNQKASIKVSEKNGREMTYTIAIVDEGLLDITKFKTPNPWDFFYQKEALGVKTWDMYDDVIGAFSGKLDQILSVGGDGSVILGDAPKANRFKPMVRFVGPFFLPANGEGKHQIDIPNYVGSARVMVVARDKEAYGSAQKDVLIKKPLMVLGTLPRVLSPEETIDLPVNVFAMKETVKNVKVKVEVNDLFTLLNGSEKSVRFDEVGDKVVNFKLKVKNKTGLGKVKIVVTSGNEKAYYEVELDVLPSNPKSITSTLKYLSPGEEWESNLAMDGIVNSNKATIGLSLQPSISIEKRLEYLIQYPHGCIEQTTSSVFPQLFLKNIKELSKNQQRMINANIKSALIRLQSFQTSRGGMAYWPGLSSENEWGTNYAFHFILEAEDKGFSLPIGMKSRIIDYQRQKARNWSQDYSRSVRGMEQDQLTQAYRLYTLAKSGKEEVGAMNRLREMNRLGESAKLRLAGAYAVIGRKDIAKKLIAELKEKVTVYRELNGTFGSTFRDRAMKLEVLNLLDLKEKAVVEMKELAKVLNSNQWLSTQETAYALLAIAQMRKTGTALKTSDVSVQWNGGQTKEIAVGNKMNTVERSDNKNGKIKTVRIKNNGSHGVFVELTEEKYPQKANVKSESNGLDLSINYYDMNKQKLSIDKIAQGTEFTIKLTVKNTNVSNSVEQIALSHLIPKGWEIHNARLFGGRRSSVDYQDYRDDRVLSYFNLRPGQQKEIELVVTATYLGHFYLPAIKAEAMYDNALRAVIKGKWIDVVK